MIHPTTHPQTGLEIKFTNLSGLTETGRIGRIRGYASRFGEPDQSGDVVAPGAFAASLALVWLVVWRTNRSDAAFERTVRRQTAVDPSRLAGLDELPGPDGVSTEDPAGQNKDPSA